jgi:hypothetical protein
MGTSPWLCSSAKCCQTCHLQRSAVPRPQGRCPGRHDRRRGRRIGSGKSSRPRSRGRRQRSNCLRHPSTAAPRRSWRPMGSRPSLWSSWSTLGWRRRAPSAWSSAGAALKSPVCGLPRLGGGRSRSFDGPDFQARIGFSPIRRVERGHRPVGGRAGWNEMTAAGCSFGGRYSSAGASSGGSQWIK